MRLTFFLIINLLFFNTVLHGQQDPDFYLVDSLDLNTLTENDKVLLDSTLELYHDESNDTSRLNLLNHIVNNCWNDEVWPLYNNYLKKEAQFLSNTTVNAHPDWYKKIGSMLAITINNEGYEQFYYGNIDGALNKYYESLHLRERLKDSLGISECYNNIGGIYYSQENYEKAVEYFKLSLEIKINSNALLPVAISLNNIGSIYNTLGELDSAQHYFNRCLEIYRKERNDEGVALCYHNLASIHAKNGDTGLARLFFLKSININERIGIFRMVANSYFLLGKMYMIKGDLTQAEDFAVRSLEISNELGYPDEIKEAADILYQLYSKKGNFRKALEMHELYVLMKDSVRTAEIEQDIENRLVQYQFEKKALADSLKHAEETRLNKLEISKRDAVIKQDKILNFALVSGVVFLLVISGLILFALRNKRRANIVIAAQKQEVEKQRDLVEEQHAITDHQRKILEIQNKEILDSITYAKRLQEAILPPEELRRAYLPNSFILYKPKDIVAGDFYWIEKVDSIVYFAAADCTGHGVPGAFVSLVCSNALNSAILELGAAAPSQLLDRVTELVVKAFENTNHQIKDGMDIALCAYDEKTMKLQYSGAYNPLWVVSKRFEIYNQMISTFNEINGKVIHEIKGTKQPVGKYTFKKDFENHEIQLEKDDIIYLLSDGYPDQFGGKKGKKFKYKQLKNLLLVLSEYPLEEQKRSLNQTFEKWKGELEQIDDVCVIGVKI